jgi:trehalose 6-phosphate synthase/trehalose 6-phosphate phosphatase
MESERSVTPEAAEQLDSFFTALGAGARPLLLVDYDGTLSAIRVDRFQARPWAGVAELLSRIQAQGRTRMAVITGRPAHEIAPLLGLDPPLEVWGLHGAERLYPDGRRELEAAPPASAAKLEELRRCLRRDSLGGLVEDKANGVAMHWRGATRKKAELIEQRTRALFEPLARLEGMELEPSDACLELRLGRDKGGAVEAILAEGEAAGPVAYLGDDWSDEAAFRVVNRLGSRGLSVLARRQGRGSAAAVWLRPPRELREFLRRWLSVLAG